MSKRRFVLQSFKHGLTQIGSFLPERVYHDIHIVLNYMRLGRWMRDQGYRFSVILPNREACWKYIADRVGDEPVLYLEFGVHRGESIKHWATLLRHPDTELHGFDSFEGLPETFDERRGLVKGAFDVGGQLPKVTDLRIQFHKGWFDDTLLGWMPPTHHRVILGLDADLYSSTQTVFRYLDRVIQPGTYIYFDDFAHVDHEVRAFEEYCQATGKRFMPVVAERGLNRCIFECIH